MNGVIFEVGDIVRLKSPIRAGAMSGSFCGSGPISA